MSELTLVEAVRSAIAEEMDADERVILLGEDVGAQGGVFRATEGCSIGSGSSASLTHPWRSWASPA